MNLNLVYTPNARSTFDSVYYFFLKRNSARE